MKKKELSLVRAIDLYVGMKVIDGDGDKGIVRSCDDLHNVYVTFEGTELGEGSGFYCLIEGCKDNLTKSNNLYYEK